MDKREHLTEHFQFRVSAEERKEIENTIKSEGFDDFSTFFRWLYRKFKHSK